MNINKLRRYEHTIYASYLGYITQAIVNNYAPLLFLWFRRDFSLSIAQITLITTVNFGVQLLVDALSAGFVDKIGYRASAVVAHIFAVAGLAGMTFLPSVFPSSYTGLMISVILYAIGGGLIEVIISPIVEACPTEKKEAAMSLLHSFYCWGHVGVVLISTAFFAAFGVNNWRILAWLFALIPLFNTFYFMCVPLYPIVKEGEKMSFGSLIGSKIFWLFLLMMICAGASEQAVSQWSSAFAESALGVSKTVGDLAGPCAFAFLMGVSRAIYGKFGDRLPLKACMVGSSIMCIICYVMICIPSSAPVNLAGCALCGFSVGIFWPGTFSLAAKALPAAGTAMYALMALAGDVGCSSGPSLVGLVTGISGSALKTGIICAVIFPSLMLLCILVLRNGTGRATAGS